MVDPENQAITIQADRCFQVDISNSETDELVVAAEMEGEYASNLLVNLLQLRFRLIIRDSLHVFAFSDLVRLPAGDASLPASSPSPFIYFVQDKMI